MRCIRILAILAILLPLSAAASPILPSEPSSRDIPSRNYLGERVRGISLYATNVMRLEDGEIVVLYGFIVGQMNGGSNYFLWNDQLNMSCFGKTERMSDGSGLGEYLCQRDGTVILRDSFGIIAEKYMKFRGDVIATYRGRNDGTFLVGLQWQGREQFPDYRPLVAAVQ